jgi:hypothetical protein
MRSVVLWAEFKAAMHPSDYALLQSDGIASDDIERLIGRARIQRTCNGMFYEPAPGGLAAYISPVLVHDELTPESRCPAYTARCGRPVDLVAWHPRWPDRWALRTGASGWLGVIWPQYCDPPPVPVRRSVLSWLQRYCTGLVLLSRDSAVRCRVLNDCRGASPRRTARTGPNCGAFLITHGRGRAC